jgi:UMF1 family MFS transporter
MTPRAPEQPPPRPDFFRHASTFSKAPSLSPSNEADDEQSMSEETSAMDSNSTPPHYEGEDTRLTSDKELSGFYMYGWAAEVRLNAAELWPT